MEHLVSLFGGWGRAVEPNDFYYYAILFCQRLATCRKLKGTTYVYIYIYIIFLPQQTPQKTPAPGTVDTPAAITAAPGFDGGVHAVRFIKQGLPHNIEKQLIAGADAKGMKVVLEADRR